MKLITAHFTSLVSVGLIERNTLPFLLSLWLSIYNSICVRMISTQELVCSAVQNNSTLIFGIFRNSVSYTEMIQRMPGHGLLEKTRLCHITIDNWNILCEIGLHPQIYSNPFSRYRIQYSIQSNHGRLIKIFTLVGNSN